MVLGGVVGFEDGLHDLRDVLEDMREPLHRVLGCDVRLCYPRCSHAASSIAARYLRSRGFDAEVVPLIYVGDFMKADIESVLRLLALPYLDREPLRLRQILGEGFFDTVLENMHQSVGVRLRAAGLRYILVDYLLPQLFGGSGSDLDYVVVEACDDEILVKYSMVIVSPKFIRSQHVESVFLGVKTGPVAVDLEEDYAAFKRLVDGKRRGV